MKIEHYVVGLVGTNCYFAIHQDTKECLVIDPGDQGQMLAEKIKAVGLTPVAILLTHGHFDHIMGVETLRRMFSIPVYVHEDDADMLHTPEQNCGDMIGRTVSICADRMLKDGDTLELAGFEIQVLHTPGHTPGGVCYYFPQEGVVFSGDTLFCGSVGRTDLPGGSMSALVRSVREKVFSLPDLTLVYPGHGEPTKISTEKQNNPFL
jgi:glyoxylase-like metal-dependent hydrolase (beta-lactamase superfamily II)